MGNRRKLEIGQFAPSVQDGIYLGARGWGFDINGYRIVIYGPPEYDTDHTAQILKKLRTGRRQRLYAEPDQEIPDSKLTRREKQRDRRLSNDEDDRHEHGPAHIHVFHLHDKAESKFELVEHHEKGKSFARLLPNGNGTKPLTGAQIQEVEALLEPHVERFIQLWREMYQHRGLSRHVTRISRIGKDEIEHNFIKKRGDAGEKSIWLEIRGRNGDLTWVPPPENPQPKRHADEIGTRRGNKSDIWQHL